METLELLENDCCSSAELMQCKPLTGYVHYRAGPEVRLSSQKKAYALVQWTLAFASDYYY